MGNVFSQEEKKELAPHLIGYEPAALASVMWDCINEIEMNDKEENFGISFNGAVSSNHIIFWDDSDVTDLPKNVFLEILKMLGEEVVRTFQDNYDLERSAQLNLAVNKLKISLKYLERHLSSLEGKVDVMEYRKSLCGQRKNPDEGSDESGDPWLVETKQPLESISSSDNDSSETDLSEISSRKPDPIELPISGKPDSSGLPPDTNTHNTNTHNNIMRRRSSVTGITSVLDRLPELRGRLDSDNTSDEQQTHSFQKVKKKVKLLSLFNVKKDQVHPGGTAREDKVQPRGTTSDKEDKVNPGGTEVHPKNSQMRYQHNSDSVLLSRSVNDRIKSKHLLSGPSVSVPIITTPSPILVRPASLPYSEKDDNINDHSKRRHLSPPAFSTPSPTGIFYIPSSNKPFLKDVATNPTTLSLESIVEKEGSISPPCASEDDSVFLTPEETDITFPAPQVP